MHSAHNKILSSRTTTLVLLGTLMLCALVYLPALNGDLIFDDIPLLLQRECWRGLDKVPAMFGLGDPSTCTYRPGRYLTFALDYTIGGLNPLVFHISNLVYHLLTTIAVYFLFRRWASAGAAVLMMGLWALHPVHADCVAYISGRRDVISTLLFVVAFLQFLPPKAKSVTVWRLLLGLGLFYLALRTKEMAVTLPAALIWAGIVNHIGRMEELATHLKKRWPVYLVLLASAGAFFAYRGVIDPHTNMRGHWWGGDWVSNFATVFTLYVHYLWLVLWPVRLVGDYFPMTIPLAHSFTEPMVLLGIGLYLAIVALIVVSGWRGWRATAFGLGWFLIAMLPVSHIIPHHELFAEHYLYLPMIGLAAAVLPVADRLLSATRRTHHLALVLACLVMVAYSGRTALRAAEYQTARSFYETAHHRAPQNARILYNLGLTYLEANECDQAMPLLLGAAKYIRRGSAMSRGNLVAFMNCSERLGRSDLVDLLSDELLRRHPDDPLGLAWRGRRHLETNRFEEAIENLSRSVERDGGRDPDAVAMLAMALNLAERPGDALAVLRQHPSAHKGHCEQEVHALIDLGVEHYSEAFERVQTCLHRYPTSLLLLEFRAALHFSSGHRDLAHADIDRMEALGAPEETLERIRVTCGLH